MKGIKQLLLILAVVMLVGCGKKGDSNTGVINPNKPAPKAVPVNIDNPIVEEAIREQLKKPTGALTQVDLENMTKLSLHYNQLTEVPKGLEKLTQLEVLYLHGNQLTDVKGIEKLTKLESLNLTENQLTNVIGLEKLTQLKALRLQFNQLADVKGLGKLTKLEILGLSNNQLTDVKGLENLAQLTILGLGKNQLTEVPKGLEKLTKVKFLSLYGNQLTNVKNLEKLEKLKDLNLRGNPDLTKAQITELQKALPNCNIKSNPAK